MTTGPFDLAGGGIVARNRSPPHGAGRKGDAKLKAQCLPGPFYINEEYLIMYIYKNTPLKIRILEADIWNEPGTWLFLVEMERGLLV